MGGIYSSRRVREELAPQLTARLLAEKVDVALLVPSDRSVISPWD